MGNQALECDLQARVRSHCPPDNKRVKPTVRLNNSLYAFLNNLLNVLPGVGRAKALGLARGHAMQHCGRKLKISSNVNIFNAKK